MSETESLPVKANKRGGRRVTDLPPCDVCGEKASGLHYGVNSCEACKGFFYRNFKRAEDIACEREENCDPEPGFGYHCPACRMKKCLELGMSLKSIKKGRYTYEMRSHLKKAIGQHKVKIQTGRLEPQTITLPEDSFVLRPLSEGEVECFETQIGVNLNTDRTLKPQTGAEDDTLICGNDLVDWDGTAMSALVPLVDENPVPSFSEQQNQIEFNIGSPTSELTRPLSPEEIMAIVRNLDKLYSSYLSIYPPNFSEQLKIEQSKFLDNERQKKRVFGKRDQVPDNEYFEIFRKTGIDVDNRLKPMKDFFPIFEEICQKYVQYVQGLPGFDKLGKADQLSVLKGGKTSFWMLCHYPAIDIENGLLTCHNYLTFKEDDLAFFNSKDSTTKLFGIAGKLQKLNLTSNETNVLRAFVIFNPDLCVTEEGKIHVEIQRSIMFQVLQYLITKHDSTGNHLISDFAEIEKDMIDFDRKQSIHWIFLWTRYHSIISKTFNDLVDMPVMSALYDCYEQTESNQ